MTTEPTEAPKPKPTSKTLSLPPWDRKRDVQIQSITRQGVAEELARFVHELTIGEGKPLALVCHLAVMGRVRPDPQRPGMLTAAEKLAGDAQEMYFGPMKRGIQDVASSLGIILQWQLDEAPGRAGHTVRFALP